MNLALFLTSGTSLKLWKERGWLDGGSGIKTYNAWSKHFNIIYFISYGGSDDLRYQTFLNHNIRVLPKKIALPSWLYCFLIPFIYRKELKNCDLYTTTQMEGAWSAAIAKKLYGKKFILRCGYQWGLSLFGKGFKGWFGKFIAPFLERFTYKMADYNIVTSHFAKEHINKTYGISLETIDVIPNPVDTTLFKPKDVPRPENSLVYVGRLEKEKNPLILLEALIGLNIKLTIFGSGTLEPELRAFSIKNKIDVDFRGNVPTHILAKEINNHEIFVAPSLYENSPKALFEAMSSGLVIVGTNVRGINEIITHQKNGILCDPTPSSIHDAIIKIIGNKQLRETLKINARQYALANFDLTYKITKDLEIFHKVLS